MYTDVICTREAGEQALLLRDCKYTTEKLTPIIYYLDAISLNNIFDKQECCRWTRQNLFSLPSIIFILFTKITFVSETLIAFLQMLPKKLVVCVSFSFHCNRYHFAFSRFLLLGGYDFQELNVFSFSFFTLFYVLYVYIYICFCVEFICVCVHLDPGGRIIIYTARVIAGINMNYAIAVWAIATICTSSASGSMNCEYTRNNTLVLRTPGWVLLRFNESDICIHVIHMQFDAIGDFPESCFILFIFIQNDRSVSGSRLTHCYHKITFF